MSPVKCLVWTNVEVCMICTVKDMNLYMNLKLSKSLLIQLSGLKHYLFVLGDLTLPNGGIWIIILVKWDRKLNILFKKIRYLVSALFMFSSLHRILCQHR